MKANSIGKSFTIEKILKIDFQNFHILWKASKSISWTFIGSLHNETIVKYAFIMLRKKYFTVYPRPKRRSMKTITFKINGQTFKYEVKVQALKYTSWIKRYYLARFFCTKSIKQPQLLLTNWLLFCLIVRKE